jgi:nucleoid DNA-binding protein
MNKKSTFHGFVARVAERAGISRQLAHDFIKELGAIIDAGLIRDGHVRLARLGTFRLGKIAEHMGVNPQTRDRMVIPEHTRVMFRPVFALANQVNAEYNHLQPEPLKRTGNPSDNPGKADPEQEPEQEAKPPEEKKPPAEKKPPTPPPPPSKTPTRTYAMIGAAVIVVIILALILFRGGDDEATTPAEEVSPPVEEVQPQPPEEPAKPEPVTEPEDTFEPEPEFAYEPEPVEEEYTPSSSTVYIQGTPAQIHIVHRTDNLWNLAGFYYEESTFWPLILQANKPLRFNPDLLFTGIDLVVPMLEGFADELTSADLSNLADAYQEAFEAYRSLGKPDAEDYLKRSRRFSQ